jgi:hypothetical protein
MTIKECIDKFDNLSPNQYSEEVKVDWLSRLDSHIFTEVILKHEPRFPFPLPFPFFRFSKSPIDKELDFPRPFPPRFEPYSTDNMTKRLIVSFPHDELYIAYLQMKVDEANKETAQYNNSATLFNNYYDEFVSQYNRDNRPVNKARYNMWRR